MIYFDKFLKNNCSFILFQAKTLHRNPSFQKCVSTQTTSSESSPSQKIRVRKFNVFYENSIKFQSHAFLYKIINYF